MLTCTLIDAVSAATNITGNSYELGDYRDYSIHVDFSGSNLAGTLKLQSSYNNSDWVDVAGSSQAITSAASHVWETTAAGYRYVKPVWTASSGTGTATAVISVKQPFLIR